MNDQEIDDLLKGPEIQLDPSFVEKAFDSETDQEISEDEEKNGTDSEKEEDILTLNLNEDEKFSDEEFVDLKKNENSKWPKKLSYKNHGADLREKLNEIASKENKTPELSETFDLRKKLKEIAETKNYGQEIEEQVPSDVEIEGKVAGLDSSDEDIEILNEMKDSKNNFRVELNINSEKRSISSNTQDFIPFKTEPLKLADLRQNRFKKDTQLDEIAKNLLPASRLSDDMNPKKCKKPKKLSNSRRKYLSRIKKSNNAFFQKSIMATEVINPIIFQSGPSVKKFPTMTNGPYITQTNIPDGKLFNCSH